jgi:hypothetical protein
MHHLLVIHISKSRDIFGSPLSVMSRRTFLWHEYPLSEKIFNPSITLFSKFANAWTACALSSSQIPVLAQSRPCQQVHPPETPKTKLKSNMASTNAVTMT